MVTGPPGEVSGVQAEATSVTSTSIDIFWFPGKANGYSVQYYIIQAEALIEPDVWLNVIVGMHLNIMVHVYLGNYIKRNKINRTIFPH